MSSSADKLFRFCVVGGIVALVDFSFIWLFVQAMPRLVAVALAYLLAVTLHFCLNRWWVFAATANPAAVQLKKYALAVAACWLCTIAVAASALATVTPNVFLAKLVAIPPATLLGFRLMKGFVFRPASGEVSGQCKG